MFIRGWVDICIQFGLCKLHNYIDSEETYDWNIAGAWYEKLAKFEFLFSWSVDRSTEVGLGPIFVKSKFYMEGREGRI